MEDFEKSKVYIQIDERNRILRCEGGFSMTNIQNIDEWLVIDEGVGDKYYLCQSHYFDGGLYTDDGIPRYKYDFITTQLRTEEEIEADRQVVPIPKPTPTGESVTWEEMAMAISEGVNEV